MVLLLLLGSWVPAVGRAAETGGVEAGGAGVGGPVRAAHAMVAAANPLAAAAGLAALRDGGSAVDAAVATQLVLGVVEPQASGLWGGGLMVLWDARARRLEGLDGLAAAPAAVPARLDRDDGGAVIPRATLDHSGRAVAVPGVMPMLAAAERAHGRLPWSRLARDAIRLAEDGFPLPPHLHAVLLRQPGLAHVPAFARFFDAAGTPLPVGTMLRDPEQARTLRLLAQGGPDALRAGEVAGAVVAAVHAEPLPGGVTAADLAGYRPRERAPVCVDAFGRRVCAAAPPSAGGVAVLQELVMLERAGIARAAPGSVAAVHLILQAGRLAAADRRRWLGDPDQVAVRTRGLLDPAYLRERAALIHPGAADADVRAGDPPADGRQGALPPSSEALAQPATSHVAVVDRDGNAASFTTTVNLDFGAWRLAGGAVLNNAMTNFASGGASGGASGPGRGGAAALNAMAPGRRPITTMAPTVVLGADGAPLLVVGAGGGARIIDAVVETLLGVLAWGLDPRAAIEQPRVGAQNRAAELERGTAAAALLPALEALGDHPVLAAMDAGVQAVERLPDGALLGWGDRHRDGTALGD